MKCPVPGCKFGGFFKIFDQYHTVLKDRLITNNGNHDDVLASKWNLIDWNYGENRSLKRGINVAIITHFAKIQ